MGTRALATVASLLLSLAAGTFATALTAQPQPGFHPPDSAAFLRHVREAVRQEDERLAAFTYVERGREVRVSKLGKVTVGPERSFEVYPSTVPGETYKRLIAVDGKPLGREELARRDAERRQDLAERARREATESPAARRKRLAAAADELAEREQMINDAFAVFEARWIGREMLDGVPVIVADLSPHQEANVSTREGRWMKHFAGRVWIDETTHQIAKIDMHAIDDISIGWGIVGRIYEKTRIVATRTRVGNIWMPSQFTIDASGRTLMFRAFEVRLATSYSDYKPRSSSAQ